MGPHATATDIRTCSGCIGVASNSTHLWLPPASPTVAWLPCRAQHAMQCFLHRAPSASQQALGGQFPPGLAEKAGPSH
jgi:hypothetical protein